MQSHLSIQAFNIRLTPFKTISIVRCFLQNIDRINLPHLCKRWHEEDEGLGRIQ